ncbi:DUF3054 domain-containing protein [Halorhabdus sp. CBA1104]|uniref:DUF3054 domain-containing protein n=1 Tax=unclassified Halorhabdus TaxID=2621901 RepID=UPI0012B21BF7|nr:MULTISPECIES: DUF3054 domain-containing protein [unclassified Halorhabdus]QGN07278.1 DUF3054 domain-containing protein [Halorhabdus sp. CBA1104]
MVSVAATLRNRIDVSAATAILAAGDLVAIAAFVVIGTVGAHQGSLSNVAGMLETLVPFLVGWVLAAFLGSLYTEDARRSVLRAVSWTIPAWITAALIAQVLRWSPLTPDSFSAIFLAVSIATGLVLLGPWRGIVAYWLSDGTWH